MIKPGKDGLYHPASEDDIIKLIKHAKTNGLHVRVRGAGQSVNEAIFTAGFPKSQNINMQLDQFRAVKFDKANMQVTVGGGCNFSVDPFDPMSTEKNSLYGQLSKKGWALANVPEVAHQTVAGFLSTGSSAGSTHHSFDACVVAITVIDGTGTRKTFTRSSNLNDPFFAVGASLGLMGIITSVTLQCVKDFHVVGTLMVHHANALPFDFVGKGKSKKPSLEKYLADSEFTRLMWWPFPTVNRVIAWQARTMKPKDYNRKTGTRQKFKPQPYQPTFPPLFGTTLPSRMAAAIGFRLLGMWPDWLKKLIPFDRTEQEVEQIVAALFPALYPKMLDFFFPLTDARKQRPVQHYWDTWSAGLMIDAQEFSDTLFNMIYTEIWVDIKHTGKLINTFQDHYAKAGLTATWFYATEVYGAKKSDFWMSPGYGRNSVRISILWWTTNKQPAMQYYQQFWDLLRQKDIPFRLHWGKYLPPPKSKEGPALLRNQYPKWDDFMTLRKQMDPDNIFLTSYWKTQLGIS